ncbi:succinyl-diaminopimelate desuccinylase [Halopenitus malekzadehii]|uniref:Succinyl-diaminopimelate desuccinylase n=1 Tax=Halopenitus malekzadehii TaxID=1267564 RepID=A0A1H6K3B1_9EURY|nr:peptidase dimerization domain-containing protein [Halopenitus malekzadehii]SEH65889.1 succinyl-diaminopimelate desuccinylase [Halopenitus malekzadehii]
MAVSARRAVSTSLASGPIVSRDGANETKPCRGTTPWVGLTPTTPQHAAYPDQGTNPIPTILPVLEALKDYDARVRERDHPLCGREYASMTGLDAGTKENVIPEQATVTIDRRFSPSRSIEDVSGEIDEVLSDVADRYGLDIDWERTQLYESAETDVDNPTARVLRSHGAAAVDVSTEPAGAPWSCDFRNLVNEGGMTNSVVWGPGDVSQAGTFDEHVDLESATVGLNVLGRAVDDLLEREP